jgi:hypothetical protein
MTMVHVKMVFVSVSQGTLVLSARLEFAQMTAMETVFAQSTRHAVAERVSPDLIAHCWCAQVIAMIRDIATMERVIVSLDTRVLFAT